MRHILPIFTLFTCICACFSCGGNKKNGQADAVTGDNIPTMITHNDIMLISDSGIIKYRAISPVWTSYGDESKEAYDYFPQGIRFEQIDSTKSAQQTIIADTAYNWSKQQLWHLIGHVEVTSVQGELFRTEELYWNMKDHTVYSDSFIHIERTENIIEGYGFTSNDDFSKYEIRQTSGVFPAREQPNKVSANSNEQTTAE